MHSRAFTLRPTARSVADKPISSLQIESTKTWQHRVQNIIKYKVINYKNIIKCMEMRRLNTNPGQEKACFISI